MKKMLLVLISVFLSSPLFAGEQPMAGSDAPSGNLQEQKGVWHTLESYRGQWLAVYFYPKDDTPGCTTESCDFRDNLAQLNNSGVQISGIAKDSVSISSCFI